MRGLTDCYKPNLYGYVDYLRKSQSVVSLKTYLSPRYKPHAKSVRSKSFINNVNEKVKKIYILEPIFELRADICIFVLKTSNNS